MPAGTIDERHQWPYWTEQADKRFLIRNYGVNGERTDQIARRLASVTQTVDVVIIQGGINDLVQGRRPSDAAAHIRAMMHRGKELGGLVAVADVLPWNNGYPGGDGPIRDLNKLIHQLAKDEGVLLLRFYATLEDPQRRGRMKEAWTTDGNHPSAHGHRRLGQLVLRAVGTSPTVNSPAGHGGSA